MKRWMLDVLQQFPIAPLVSCSFSITFKTLLLASKFKNDPTPTYLTLYCTMLHQILQHHLHWSHHPSGYKEDLHQDSSLF
ncbi:hypothetical protein QTP70_013395 [Hemibagrus guttatus]|uniref:Uncharacterized protein n=1 Tax=Hemibagrus guttatus TaxID=175788 RepID=A0AAE0QET4_9TELE|nr:hypothetical protein QTP70_013395 [Hemibagrus guttatus]